LCEAHFLTDFLPKYKFKYFSYQQEDTQYQQAECYTEKQTPDNRRGEGMKREGRIGLPFNGCILD